MDGRPGVDGAEVCVFLMVHSSKTSKFIESQTTYYGRLYVIPHLCFSCLHQQGRSGFKGDKVKYLNTVIEFSTGIPYIR